MLKYLCWLLLIAAAAPDPVRGQDRPPTAADTVGALDLPEGVAATVVDVLNDPARKQFRGPTRLAAGEVLRGDVAVLHGPYEVLGRVEGSVMVVNGDLRLRPGAAVTGDILVVGGSIVGADAAEVRGEIRTYAGRLAYREEGGRIVRVPAPGVDGRTGRGELGLGRSDFLISTGRSYNRIEGLPITFGPRIQTEGSNPLRVHALAIYRTATGFSLDPERMGFYVRAEQFLGGRRETRVGVTAHSVVEPIEEWHLSDLENGLSTFLFHRDFRDYYEREGYSAFAIWEPQGAPVEAMVEVRSETHGSLRPRSPWTLFDNADPWRPQPLVAQGDLTSVALQTELDTRSSASDPATGWLVRGRVERSLRLGLRVVDPVEPRFHPDAYHGFASGLVDLRRYNRVDPVSRLNFRVVAGGSLDGSTLPAQRQHSLGGEGSLPGYPLFEMDCGAREGVLYTPPGDPSTPSFRRYGCDAFGLLQAEFRGKLDFNIRFDSTPWDDDEGGWGFGWAAAPDWTVFMDAGRAWSFDDAYPDEDVRVDAGFGVLVDRFGIYVARPITGGLDGLNFFVRLGPRF